MCSRLEGYDAAQQAKAKEMASALRSIMVRHVPAYGDYLDQYAKASEPLRPFQSMAGNRTLADVDEFSDIPMADVSTLPDTFFKTPQSYQNLKDMIGDPDKANAIARDFVANKVYHLTDNKSAGAAASSLNSWLHSPQGEWLNEVPELKSRVGDLQSRLAAIPKTRAAVGGGAAAAALIYYKHSVWGLRSLMSAFAGGG